MSTPPDPNQFTAGALVIPYAGVSPTIDPAGMAGAHRRTGR